MQKKGIDVSYHQGNIDWGKVKNAGIEFAILRIGYGMYDFQKDKQFENNYKNARAKNIPVGIYHYSYATSIEEAEKEANLVLQWLNGRELDYPVYFDIEDNSMAKLGKSTLNAICRAFCEIIEKAGYWAGIYSNKDWATNKISGAELGKDYTYWIAQYNDKCTYTGPYAIWQYSSTGSVNGISGNVDMNIQYKEVGGKTGSTSNSSSKKSNETIANEVIRGEWGNGNDRKNRLNSAGYDYNAVQSIVNAKLAGTQTIYYKKYTGSSVSIVDALKAIGVDSSMNNRKNIAKKNGIGNYTGTASQNTKLLNLLKQGKLKK